MVYDLVNHTVTYGDPSGGSNEATATLRDANRYIESVTWCLTNSSEAGGGVILSLSNGDSLSFAAIYRNQVTCLSEPTWTAERYSQIIGFRGFRFGDSQQGSGPSDIVQRTLFTSPYPTPAPTSDPTPAPTVLAFASCRSWYRAGFTADGVYNVKAEGGSEAYEVYCDQTTDGGGWMLTLSYVNAYSPYFIKATKFAYALPP